MLALEEYGFGAGIPTRSDEYLESLGIEIRPVAGCVVDDTVIGHASGFNRVMTKAIKARFGSDVFARAEQQNQRSEQDAGVQPPARRGVEN